MLINIVGFSGKVNQKKSTGATIGKIEVFCLFGGRNKNN